MRCELYNQVHVNITQEIMVCSKSTEFLNLRKLKCKLKLTYEMNHLTSNKVLSLEWKYKFCLHMKDKSSQGEKRRFYNTTIIQYTIYKIQ